eukprot:364746-Chlamydomonas_euryale.AAC.3
MEVEYLRRAKRDARMRRPILLHGAACVAGLACFATEELHPEVPLMHASWCVSGGVDGLHVHVWQGEGAGGRI